MTRYERRLWWEAFWAEVRLWLLIAAIICIPMAMALWVLLEVFKY